MVSVDVLYCHDTFTVWSDLLAVRDLDHCSTILLLLLNNSDEHDLPIEGPQVDLTSIPVYFICAETFEFMGEQFNFAIEYVPHLQCSSIVAVQQMPTIITRFNSPVVSRHPYDYIYLLK